MSLRIRLTLWYGTLAGLVVLALSLLSYSIASRGRYDDLDRVLRGTAAHLLESEAVMRSPEAFRAMLAQPILPSVIVRLDRPDGTVLTASPNTSLGPAVDPRQILLNPAGPPFDPLVGLAPALRPIDTGQGTFSVITDAAGNRWRVYAMPVNGANQDLVLLAPLAQIDAFVTGFRRLEILLAVPGALVTLFGGWILTCRALCPVTAVTNAAQTIAHSHDFTRRVPVTTHRDELSHLATTFNEMLEALAQAYQSQQRFVSDASHELRAPLTAIQANLELIERRPDLRPEDQREAITEASKEARRLARLVSDLLALARADAGVPLREETVELDRLLLEVVSEAHRLGDSQRITVDRIEPVVLRGDPDRLKQLLVILVDNAIKYTPPDGEITLGLVLADHTASLSVRDTGAGIPAEDLPHVFERFYRADPARARDPSGTGLGLSIAQWIARQHGGDIVLESAVGNGTLARVQLPIRA